MGLSGHGHGPPNNIPAGNNHAGCGGANAGHGRGQQQPIPTLQRFESETDALLGHIYDLVGSKSADLFIKTMKAIAGYVSQNYHHGGDTHLVIE